MVQHAITGVIDRSRYKFFAMKGFFAQVNRLQDTSEITRKKVTEQRIFVEQVFV